MAVSAEISPDAAIAAVLSTVDSICSLKDDQDKRYYRIKATLLYIHLEMIVKNHLYDPQEEMHLCC